MRVARAILASVALFALLLGVSAAAYPGGTWMDARSPGFDWVRNLLCDLLAPVALNGQPSRFAAITAGLGMVSLDVGLALAFWFLPPRFFPDRPRLGRWVRALGVVAALGLLMVPVTPPSPESRFAGHHMIAVAAGGVPALFAMILGVAGLAAGARAPRMVLYLGGAMLAVLVIEMGIYGRYLATGGVPPLILPLLERPALLLVLAWLVAIARAMPLRERRGA